MGPFCSLSVVFVFVVLSCLFLAALWSPPGRGWPLGSLVCYVFLSCGVPGQVWYLIASITDLCFLICYTCTYHLREYTILNSLQTKTYIYLWYSNNGSKNKITLKQL